MRTKHSILSLLTHISLLVLLLAGQSYAAETWLSAIGGLDSPHKVAVTPDGNIMVTEPVWDRISVFDHEGHAIKVQLNDAAGVKHPQALAVDASGNVYLAVGKYSSNNPPYVTPGEVMVFDSGFHYLRSLGSGPGEFVNPTDIAVGSDGRIYVADADLNKVKVYNSDGTAAFSFGQSGQGDGYFNMPQAVALDDATGTIYIADRQLIQDPNGVGNVSGARIQAFTSEGVYKSGFGSYGPLVSPSDLAFRNGRVYVTDSYLDLIKVFDASTGAALYSMTNPSSSIRVPASIAISADGLMYVAGQASNDINVFGMDGYGDFTVTPEALQFRAYADGTAPALKQFAIANTGTVSMQWAASADQSWITLDAASGSLDPGASHAVQAGINQGGMAVGDYAGRIKIANQNGTTQMVPVSLELKSAPVLTVSPAELTFTAEMNNPSTQSQPAAVDLAGGFGDEYWTATSDSGWLGINPVQAGSGSTPITVNVDTANLPVGTYTGQITIQAQDAAGSPSVIKVKLDVLYSGSISVSTDNAGAAFTISGDNGMEYQGSGNSFHAAHVPDGTYTIEYAPIHGYVTPPLETKSLTGGQAISFSAVYKKIMPARIAVISGKESSSVRIYDYEGTLLNEFVPFPNKEGKPGSIVIADVNGDNTGEIIVGLSGENPLVGIFDQAGNKLASFTVPDKGDDDGNMIRVAAADLDGNGASEIIVYGGEGNRVKVFSYNNGTVADTGLELRNAFSGEGKVGVCAADLDGDGKAEIVSLSGNKYAMWQVDTSGGPGNWKAVKTGNASLKLDHDSIVGLKAGVVDGNGVVLAVTKKSVIGLYGNGKAEEIIRAAGISDASLGDVDADLQTELVLGLQNGQVRTYRMDGSMLNEFRTFESKSGVSVSAGELGY